MTLAARTDADELRRVAATLDKFLYSDADVLREIAARLDERRCCDTCKWWQSPPTSEGEAGLCLHEHRRFGPAGHCGALVATDADFGCVQWEAIG